jgi:hypothetical protein
VKRILGGVVVAAAAIVHLILSLHAPISLLANASHDDTLFMRLAMHVASGEWLGPFDQYTLMKGAGYPVFVALSSRSGLPLSLSHGLFHLAAVGVAAFAAARLGGRAALGLLAFVVLLFHPVGLSSELTRVFRDHIYWGQTLLAVSALALGYFSAPDVRRAAGWCVLAGFVLAWAWSTREEGVWLLPALAILSAGAALGEWAAARSVRRTGLKTLVTAAAFASLQLALAGVNGLYYGAFLGVDFKESRFVAALNSLQSVRDGGHIPYVPVTGAARRAVYDVSPSFASMRSYFDPAPPARTPWQYGCRHYPQTCGEIAGGWWIWALRDAAARRGHYDSPHAAREFFGAVAAEVTQACDAGRLSCRGPGLSYMPRMTADQLRSLPGPTLRSMRMLLLLEPPALRHGATLGSEVEVQTFWAFLNHPKIAASAKPGRRQVVEGWFHRRGAEWPTFEILDPRGAAAPFTLKRVRSNDVAELFGDPSARHQRFHVSTPCVDGCTLVLRAGGEVARYALGARRKGLVEGEDPAARLYIEADEIQADGASSGTEPFDRVRRHLLGGYRVLVPVLVLSGLAALVGSLWTSRGRAALDPLAIVAASTWALVLARVALVVLVDASAFPAVSFQYLAPASYLIVFGALLSWAGFARARAT